MSGERFFDDLARTLAEPMPRRRAVRVIGVSLAATMVPGVGARLARAASGSTAQVTCRGDRRTCQKGADRDFETYCCPSPSWQWFCGGQDNAYRCINMCPKGAKTFPCTALVAHPDSGINGICCDRRLHSGCVPVGPPAEKRPDGSVVPSQAWKPSCCPKGRGFGFCGGVCCEAPNRCKRGTCRCPNGAETCDGRRCCKRGESCKDCFSFGTLFDPILDRVAEGEIVGKKCCPSNQHCCGTTCCKRAGCCGEKCCPFPDSRCARLGGTKVCCPLVRLNVSGADFVCCPAGTVRDPRTDGCCPVSDLDCCMSAGGRSVDCGAGKICVRGACVNP